MRLFALRGATTVAANARDEILDATSELLSAITERNALTTDALVSCLFSMTEDLDAEFPAVAARELGFNDVPLLCTREIPVPGSLPRVIRVLMHFYAAEDHQVRHVYLREAAALRADLSGAQ